MDARISCTDNKWPQHLKRNNWPKPVAVRRPFYTYPLDPIPRDRNAIWPWQRPLNHAIPPADMNHVSPLNKRTQNSVKIFNKIQQTVIRKQVQLTQHKQSI